MVRNQALDYFELLRGSGPRAYQARDLRGLLRHFDARIPGQTLTVMYPRQAGKNEVAAMYVVALVQSHADRGGSLVVCAPTYRPQVRISMTRVRRYANCVSRHTRLRPVLVDGNTLAIGAATVTFLSASPEAHVAGHTASLGIVVDEAQEVDEECYERQFHPRTATTGAPVVMFGTAWEGDALLERAADRNRRLDADRPVRERHHFQVDRHEVAKSRPAYGRSVEEVRARLGATHPTYLSQYELVPSEGAGQFLTAAQLEALEGEHGRLRAPLGGERYVAGLDFGGDRPGADRSVLTIARLAGERCEVVEHLAWRAARYDQVLAEVKAAMAAWRIERLCADGNGLGSPLAAALEGVFGHRVERFTFSAASKSELGYRLQAAANTDRLALYADDVSLEASTCRSELRACRESSGGANRMEWGNPAGTDDYVVSLALCLRAAEQVGPARVAVGRLRG